jgi:hypothetical protein
MQMYVRLVAKNISIMTVIFHIMMVFQKGCFAVPDYSGYDWK